MNTILIPLKNNILIIHLNWCGEVERYTLDIPDNTCASPKLNVILRSDVPIIDYNFKKIILLI